MEHILPKQKLFTEFIPGLILWVGLIFGGIHYLADDNTTTEVATQPTIVKAEKIQPSKPKPEATVEKVAEVATPTKNASVAQPKKKAAPKKKAVAKSLSIRLIRPLNKVVTTPKIRFKWSKLKISPSPFYKVILIHPSGERRIIGTTRANQFVWTYDELDNMQNIQWLVEGVQVRGKKKKYYKSKPSTFSFAGIKKSVSKRRTNTATLDSKQTTSRKFRPKSEPKSSANKHVVKTKTSTVRVEYAGEGEDKQKK